MFGQMKTMDLPPKQFFKMVEGFACACVCIEFCFHLGHPYCLCLCLGLNNFACRCIATCSENHALMFSTLESWNDDLVQFSCFIDK